MAKKYFKKTVAGIFAVAIVASSVPLAPYTKVLNSISITASAAETEDGLEYSVNSSTNTVTITGYHGSSSHIVIPEKIEGYDVTAIGANAFNHNGNIESISMPSVTTIGDSAFKYCYGLSTAEIPKVTSMGENAFDNCALTSVVIPEGVTRLESCVFSGNDQLAFVQIPASVEFIGEWAFGYTDIARTLQFAGCPKDLHSEAFNFSSNNTLLVPADKLNDWKAVFGMTDENPDGTTTLGATGKITLKAGYTLNFDTQGKGAPIDSQFVEINEKAEKPKTPTTDGYSFAGWYTDADCTEGNAFDFDAPLTASATVYAKWAQQHTVSFDTGTTGISIDDVLVDDGDFVSAPKDFITPDEYMFIGWFCEEVCFTPCLFNWPIREDTTIYGRWCPLSGECGEDLTWSFDKDTKELTISGNGEALGDYLEDLTDFYGLPIQSIKFETTNLKKIGEGFFWNLTELTEITLPDTVTTIGKYAFAECSSLTSVTLPDSVTKIDDYAFSRCSELKNIAIPNNVTQIGECAFARCTALKNFTIPESVLSLGAKVFEKSGLETITFESSEADDIDSLNCNGETIFKDCTLLTAIYVPEGFAAKYKASAGYQAAFGDYIELLQEKMPVVKAEGVSVSYNGDVTINFHYLVSDSYKNGYVKFGDDLEVYVSEASTDKDGYYVFPISMPAKNMYDEITAQFCDEEGNAVGAEVEFYLEKYMDGVKAYDPNYSDFVDSFLEYGAQVAAYFGVSGAPAGKSYTEDDYNKISEALAAYATVDMDEHFVGATLLLKSVPKLRLYYDNDTAVEDLEASDNNPGLYYVEQEFKPSNFRGDLNGYSVYNYIYKALQTGSDELKPLCAALYNLSSQFN